MAALATAAVVTGVVGMISGFLGSRKAAKSAKQQAAEQARIEKLTTAESVRRLGIEERAMYGQTLAGYAGGGVLGIAPSLNGGNVMAGSPQTVLAEQAKEFKKEREITQQVGASNVTQALQRGKATASAYKWQGYANAASSISNILTNYKMTGG